MRAMAAPTWLYHGVASIGDRLASERIPFPLKTFRLMDMITSQILDVKKPSRLRNGPSIQFLRACTRLLSGYEITRKPTRNECCSYT
jgi:hypothetical protein